MRPQNIIQLSDDEIDQLSGDDKIKQWLKATVKCQGYQYLSTAPSTGAIQMVVVSINLLKSFNNALDSHFQKASQTSEAAQMALSQSSKLSDETTTKMLGYLEKFSQSFLAFANSVKDMLSGARVLTQTMEKYKTEVMEQLKAMKGMLAHTRTNTSNTAKASTNMQWELKELRTAGKNRHTARDDDLSGSLLNSFEVVLQNGFDALSENLTKTARARGC